MPPKNRQAPYPIPFSFEMLLPLGVALSAKADEAVQTIEAAKVQLDALTKQVTATKGYATSA